MDPFIIAEPREEVISRGRWTHIDLPHEIEVTHETNGNALREGRGATGDALRGKTGANPSLCLRNPY